MTPPERLGVKGQTEKEMSNKQDKKNALAFLRKLEEDQELAERCDETDNDAQGIREIASEIGLPFSGFDIYRGTCARRAWKIARSSSPDAEKAH